MLADTLAQTSQAATQIVAWAEQQAHGMTQAVYLPCSGKTDSRTLFLSI
jgi:hypothetical protein